MGVRCDSPGYPQLREIWLAPVWLRPFIARRELVLRRSWRQEDDGTFVVRGPLCAPAHRQLYAPRVCTVSVVRVCGFGGGKRRAMSPNT